MIETTAVEPPRSTADDDWGPYGRRPLVLLSLVALVDAVDRGILPGVLTRVQDDLGFSDTAAGVLGTAFVVASFLVVLPAGYVADRYARTRVIAVVLATWGAVSAMTAAVTSFWQFLGVRAALGVGETVDNPSSQSLLADYYPPHRRGRVYSYQRLAPILGTGIGTGLAGLIGATLGWRWAFLLVGAPGSALAFAVWRLREPVRGGTDGLGASVVAPRLRGPRAALADMREVIAFPLLRALMFGSAIGFGALTGIGFWLPAYYDRHTDLSSGMASAFAGGLILVGALVGTYAGGAVTDRLRRTHPAAPMLVGGVSQLLGGVLLFVSFLPVPAVVYMPVQLAAVCLLVAGLPALTVMIAEVVPAALRGTAFSLSGFLGSVASAASPLVVGLVADRFPIVFEGETKGHLGHAFLIVLPLVSVGGAVVLRGRRKHAMPA